MTRILRAAPFVILAALFAPWLVPIVLTLLSALFAIVVVFSPCIVFGLIVAAVLGARRLVSFLLS